MYIYIYIYIHIITMMMMMMMMMMMIIIIIINNILFILPHPRLSRTSHPPRLRSLLSPSRCTPLLFFLFPGWRRLPRRQSTEGRVEVSVPTAIE